MTNISEAFSLLHDLVDMPKRQRAEMFNSVNSKLLQLLATDLFDSKQNPEINDQLDFCDLVERLSNREAYWSRQLGSSILQSSELEKAGEVNKAEDIMIQFISSCSSVSYCEIARAHLQATGSGDA